MVRIMLCICANNTTHILLSVTILFPLTAIVKSQSTENLSMYINSVSKHYNVFDAEITPCVYTLLFQ